MNVIVGSTLLYSVRGPSISCSDKIKSFRTVASIGISSARPDRIDAATTGSTGAHYCYYTASPPTDILPGAKIWHRRPLLLLPYTRLRPHPRRYSSKSKNPKNMPTELFFQDND